MIDVLGKLRNAAKTLQQQFMREPTTEEIAALAEVSVEEAHQRIEHRYVAQPAWIVQSARAKTAASASFSKTAEPFRRSIWRTTACFVSRLNRCSRH